LQAAADRAASKQIGDSRNRGKAGPHVDPAGGATVDDATTATKAMRRGAVRPLAAAGWRVPFRLMTAKERLMERAPHWTEEQAARALRAVEGEDSVDEWGDLATLRETSTAETMRRLAEEEHAAGQKPW
jgi:hypothetical protein